MGPTLVGRSDELATIVAAADAVSSGAGGVVHVVGEAGIGKTSLLAAAAAALDDRGVTTRAAAADETDRRRPLALARSLFADLDRHHDMDPIGRAIAATEQLAAGGPVALLADDVHWADDASLDALCALTRRARPLGVLVVTSARPHPVPPPLARLEELVLRLGRRVMPEPLAAADLATLVEHRVGARPGPRLSELLARTAGNPFLAVELIEGLRDDGGLVVGDGTVELAPDADVPERVVETVVRRTLLAVPAGELMLRAAAVLPGGFTVEELADILDRPLGEVLTVVLAAIDAGAIVDTGTTLAFRHDLLRRAVVDATPPSIVRTLHRRAADVLSARGAAFERVATCLLAGCDPADPADVERLITVGREMSDRNPVAAADLLHAALEGIPTDDPRSGATTLALGWALTDAGRIREVLPLLDERFACVDPPPFELYRLRGHALSLTGRLRDATRSYTDQYVDTLRGDVTPDDPAHVDATAELAVALVLDGRLDAAEQALTWVERSRTPPTAIGRVNAHAARAWLCGLNGAFEGAVAAARAGVDIALDDPHEASRSGPMAALGVMLDGFGDSDAALEFLRASLARASMPRWNRPLLQFVTAVVLYRRGEWDDAIAEAEAGLLGAEETDLALGVHWPFAVGTSICCARGQQPAAREWIERSQQVSATGAIGTEWLMYAHALVEEADGDVENAAKLLEVIVDAVLEHHAPALLLNPGSDAVRLALLTGRTDTATRVVDTLATVATRTASPVVHAIAGWTRGLAASDPAPAVEAAEALAGCHRAAEAARALHDAAVLSARRGLDDEGRRHARAAFTAYDSLEAEQLHARLRSELRAEGMSMRPRRSPRRPSTGFDSLTTSERRIVELVADGLTNSEIGERLYVSRRTVESHLGRVYGKLDLTTRAQLVAAVVSRRADGAA
jgi:DNA-binding CsgD family transcriptional regulator